METVELSVDGMTCGACVQAAKRALSRVSGVESVDVRLEEGAATVRGEHVAALVGRLVEALGQAGYAARVAPAGGVAKVAGAGGCGSARSGGGGCCCGR